MRMSSMPWRLSSIAAAIPPKPAPTIATDSGLVELLCGRTVAAVDIPCPPVLPAPLSTFAGLRESPLAAPGRARLLQAAARHEAVGEQQHRLVGGRTKAASGVRRIPALRQPARALSRLQADQLRLVA